MSPQTECTTWKLSGEDVLSDLFLHSRPSYSWFMANVQCMCVHACMCVCVYTFSVLTWPSWVQSAWCCREMHTVENCRCSCNSSQQFSHARNRFLDSSFTLFLWVYLLKCGRNSFTLRAMIFYFISMTFVFLWIFFFSFEQLLAQNVWICKYYKNTYYTHIDTHNRQTAVSSKWCSD